MTQTAEALRGRAIDLESASIESFERSDTDGYMSQWASDLTARKLRLEAELVESGGTWWFNALCDLEGNWVPSKLIEGRYGLAWALLGDEGQFTGDFVSAYPKKATTMRKKGYVECAGLWPGYVAMSGKNIVNVSPVVIKKGADADPPLELRDFGYETFEVKE